MLPDGFRYLPGAIDARAEAELIGMFAALPFEPYVMRGYAAKRRIVHFTPPAPFLLPVRDRVMACAGLDPAPFDYALVTEYTPGAPTGWHRDMPQYGPVVVGLSLGSACRLRFRRTTRDTTERASIVLEPRSVYVMGGASRSAWQHSIPPVERLRYSITFRMPRP